MAGVASRHEELRLAVHFIFSLSFRFLANKNDHELKLNSSKRERGGAGERGGNRERQRDLVRRKRPYVCRQ